MGEVRYVTQAELEKAWAEKHNALSVNRKADRRLHKLRQVCAAALFGCVGFFFATGIGVEPWRDNPPGDAADIGVTLAFAVYFALGFLDNRGQQ